MIDCDWVQEHGARPCVDLRYLASTHSADIEMPAQNRIAFNDTTGELVSGHDAGLTLSGKGAGGDQEIEARLSSGVLGQRHG